MTSKAIIRLKKHRFSLSITFLICGKAQLWDITRFRQWPLQCTYTAFSERSLIRRWTPTLSLDMLAAPSYPWPLTFSISTPRPCKVDTIVSATTSPVIRGRWIKAIKSSLTSLFLSMKRAHNASCSLLWLVTSSAAWLAQLGERRSGEREVTGSNPGRTNTQGL